MSGEETRMLLRSPERAQTKPHGKCRTVRPPEDSRRGRAPEHEAEHEGLLHQLAQMLDKMPQNPVAAADLEEVQWMPLFAQIGLNLFGILIFLSMAGAVQMKFKPNHFLTLFGAEVVVFTVLVFLITIIFETVFSDNSLGPKKYSSQLLHAISGRKVVRLENRFEVFALTHAVIRGPNGNLCIDRVVPDSESSHKYVLFIRKNEIQPGKFSLEYLKDRNKVQDQTVDDMKGRASHVPLTWYDDELLKLEQDRLPMHAHLKHREPLVDLMYHPVVNMCVSVALTAWQLAPLGWWIHHLDERRRRICNDSSNDTLFDWLESPKESCSSLLHFVDEVHEHYNLSAAEAISTLFLALTTVCVVAVFRERLRFHYLQDLFFCFLRLPTGGVKQLRKSLKLFEAFLNPFDIIARIMEMKDAWMKELSVLGKLPSIVRKRTANPALYEILKVLRMIVPQGDEVVFIELPCAVGKQAQEKQDKIMRTKWRQWTEHFGLMQNDASFKMMVIVPITCKEALDLFIKHFLEGEPYKKQLQAIFSRPSAQENNNGENDVETRTHFTMGPISVPCGFSLTHVLLHPHDDEEPYDIVVGIPPPESKLSMWKPRTHCTYVSGKDDFLNLFKDGATEESFQRLQSEMRFSIHENFSDLHEIPKVVLPTARPRCGTKRMPSESSAESRRPQASAEDEPCGVAQLHRHFGDTVAYSISFVFQRMKADQDTAEPLVTTCTPAMDHASDSFGRTYYPKSEPDLSKDEKELLRAVQNQTRSDAHPCKRVLVVKERGSKLARKVTTIVCNLGLSWIMAVLVSVAYGFFVPVYRWFAGDEAFPMILRTQLVWSSVNHAVFLFLFLYLFESETQRLSVIQKALHDFERKTVAPPKPGGDDTALRDPFALFVNVEEEEKENRVEEAGGSEVWRRRWTQVGLNVQNWDNCSMSLRVLVSTARLTAQAVLLLAALLMGSMLLMSVAQAVSGKGAMQINNSALTNQMKSFVHTGMDKGMDSIKEAMRRLSEANAVGHTAAAVAGAGGTSGACLTPAVLEELADCFGPFRRELREPLRTQLAALAEAPRRLEEIVKDVDISKATRTEVLTMFFSAIIAVYAIRLVLLIAMINHSVMSHESLLAEQKSSHRKVQTARHLEAMSKEEQKEEDEEETGDAQDQISTTTTQSSPSAVAQPSTRQDVPVKAPAKNPEQEHYEKMLDIAIENAHHNAARFPLRLFGFVIGFHTLVLWVGCLGTHVVHKGKAMAVPAAQHFCDWLKSHPLELNSEEVVSVEASSQTWDFLVDSVCGKLVDEVADLDDDTIAGKLQQAARLASPPGGRRLASGANSSLPAAVRKWWVKHAEVSADAKLALLQGAVREQELEAHRLLVVAPRGVYEAAHLSHGAALEAALLHWGPEGQQVVG